MADPMGKREVMQADDRLIYLYQWVWLSMKSDYREIPTHALSDVDGIGE